jgi:hypothetical protein
VAPDAMVVTITGSPIACWPLSLGRLTLDLKSPGSEQALPASWAWCAGDPG